jgi:hypothetical protein
MKREGGPGPFPFPFPRPFPFPFPFPFPQSRERVQQARGNAVVTGARILGRGLGRDWRRERKTGMGRTSSLSLSLSFSLPPSNRPGHKKKRARRARRPTRRVFPFEGSSFACRCANRVTPSCAPSREGSVLLGVFLCERLTGLLGSPSPAATSTFPPGPAVSLRPPSTSSLRLGLHPPASFPPPPECYGLRPARRISK